MDVGGAGCRDVPVLGEKTSHVAPRGADAEHAGSRKEMIQRFFLDRIDLQRRRRAVTQVVELAVLIDPNEAKASLTRTNMAMAGTEERKETAGSLQPPPTSLAQILGFMTVHQIFHTSYSLVTLLHSNTPKILH